MKKVLCTLLMAAFISPLWAAETEAAPEQKLMPAITADTGGNELGVVNDILRAASGKDSPFAMITGEAMTINGVTIMDAAAITKKTVTDGNAKNAVTGMTTTVGMMTMMTGGTTTVGNTMMTTGGTMTAGKTTMTTGGMTTATKIN